MSPHIGRHCPQASAPRCLHDILPVPYWFKFERSETARIFESLLLSTLPNASQPIGQNQPYPRSRDSGYRPTLFSILRYSKCLISRISAMFNVAGVRHAGGYRAEGILRQGKGERTEGGGLAHTDGHGLSRTVGRAKNRVDGQSREGLGHGLGRPFQGLVEWCFRFPRALPWAVVRPRRWHCRSV
jgi:hypothetical protein